jgi:hypothetical protein
MAERFTSENVPELTDEDRARLNARYDEAVRGIDPEAAYRAGRGLDLGFFDRLAEVVLSDFRTQRKVAEAFTTYQARGNREDLA